VVAAVVTSEIQHYWCPESGVDSDGPDLEDELVVGGYFLCRLSRIAARIKVAM